ncbi:MAG: [ribosomal protein S5]-alanine N-acetyltransferase [Thermoleophilaceae bacterium]|nr:[ribosomal protein S5]-alanine N-acetyltransferase [Thermoleophilaceae bacterium]
MRPGDEEALHAVWSHPTTLAFIHPDGAWTRAMTRERIADKRAHQAFHGFSMWAVLERATGEIVGDTGLQMLEGGPDVEVGWRMAPDRRGRGYAPEAARAALAAGFGELGLARIVAVTDPANTASRRVMEKLGMTLAGPGRHYGRETVLYETGGSG